MASDSPPRADPGVFHHYTDRLDAFEYKFASNARSKPNSLLFVGGLMDGICTVPYLKEIAAVLEPTDWSLFSLRLSSSYTAFGLGRLGRDVEEIAQCVQYVRSYKGAQNPDRPDGGKVVIMGHSTGSQDILHYIYSPNPLPLDPNFDNGLKHIERPQVDGAILQAPVSDREALKVPFNNGNLTEANASTAIYNQLVDMAKRVTYADNNTIDVLLPLSLTSKVGFPSSAPISARRFLSLVSPDSPDNPAEDDLFSTDLTDKRLEETFGMIATRDILKSKLLVLLSGKDQYQLDSVDKEGLLERWKAATDKITQKIWDDENAGIVPGANHNLAGHDQAAAREELAKRVARFLKKIDNQPRL